MQPTGGDGGQPMEGCGQGKTPRPVSGPFMWQVTHTQLEVNETRKGNPLSSRLLGQLDL